jgi:phage protein D
MTDTVAFVSARPRIDLDGRPADQMVSDLWQLELRADQHGMGRLRLLLTARGPSEAGGEAESLNWLDGRQIRLGSELRIEIDGPDRGTLVYQGRVSLIGARFAAGSAPLAELQAEDKLWDLRQTRRIKSWEQQDLAGIARQIASEHGLSADVQASSPNWALRQQWNETDLAFLRACCASVGAELWLDGSTLHIATREQRPGEAIALVMDNELLALQIDADLAQQRSSVAVSGFDAAAKDGVESRAESAALGGLAAGGTSGLDALQQAFGERKTQRLHDAPLNREQAEARAQAELRRRAQGFVRARGITYGSARLQVGSQLRLERVGSLFDGDGYVVAELLHRFDQIDGFRTEFVAERGCILKN